MYFNILIFTNKILIKLWNNFRFYFFLGFDFKKIFSLFQKIHFFSLLLLCGIHFKCSHLVYNPTKEIYYNPEKIGYEKKEIQHTTKDGIILTGWRIKEKYKTNKKDTVVLQLHGNGENHSSHFLSLVWLVNFGYELVTYDYRGYGKSTGEPERESIHRDTVEYIEKIHRDCVEQNKKLIIYGQSLGGAIAMRAVPELNDKSNLVLLIVEGTFSSYRKVTRSILKKTIIEPFPFLLSLLISDNFSPIENIRSISPLPVIVIHELDDPIIPFENGKDVFKNLEDPKQFWEVNSGGHIRWMQMGRSPNALKFLSLLNKYVSDRDESKFY